MCLHVCPDDFTRLHNEATTGFSNDLKTHLFSACVELFKDHFCSLFMTYFEYFRNCVVCLSFRVFY